MDRKKVLVSDENEKTRNQLARFLSDQAIDIETASSFSEVHNRLLSSNDFSLIVVSLDPHDVLNMQFLQSLKTTDNRLGVVLLSKIQNTELAITLLKEGTIDHIASRDNLAEIFSAIKNEFNKIELIEKNESYLRSLHIQKSEEQKNIKRALYLEEIYDTTLENLMIALDLRDVETFGHSRIVAKYSQVLAEILGIKEKNALDNIRKGALLHDVGKIAVPDSILKKPSSLSSQEWETIKLHPSLGFGLIKEIKLVKEVGNIILYHHERFDGTGYPKRLKKENIPFEARIFALADALDAITSHRPYRKERDFKVAKKEILDNSGTQFSPDIVEAFCSLSLERWEKIRFETTKLIHSFEDILDLQKTLNEKRS